MNVTIIGTGNMANGIATRLVAGGHTVNVHARDIAKGKTLADDVIESATNEAAVNVATIGSATDEVVIITTPYGEVENVAKQYDGFAGKVVVDITNPVDFETFQLIPAAGTSGAEEIAALLPNAKIVKAFNTIFAGTLVAGAVDGKELDVFLAGDDTEAKAAVAEIVKAGQMRPVDVGALANSRHLEGLALIHMGVQEQLGTNWGSTIKILN